MNAAFVGNPDDVQSWAVLDPLAPHALALARQADEAGIANPAARLINELALLSKQKARYAEAEPLHRRALAIYERSLGAEHPFVATALNNLALLPKDTNRLGEAEPLHHRALAILENSLGADHPTIVKVRANLAALEATRDGAA